MKPLKIGWFYQDLNPGGGQRVCREVSKRLVERGHQVRVVVPRGRAKAGAIGGIELMEAGLGLKNPAVSIVSALPFMLKAMGKQDVTISSMPLMGFLNFLSPATLKYHWIQTDDLGLFDDRTLLRAGILLKAYHFSVRLSYHLPLNFWCNSKWTGERFRRHSNKPAIIIPLGVNNQVFKPLADSGREGDLIGTMGRRVKMKGFWETTEALKMVALKGFRFRLRIITQEELPEFETQFPVELVKPANDEELAKNLGQCGLFISSSWFEGFGLPALEAMACGVPVITTDNGGCNEYARNSVNCLIVPPRRIDLLSQAIIKMRENPVLAAEFSHRGLETALKFDWDKTVDRVEEIIFKDLEGR